MNRAHLTAIARKKPSRPATYLFKTGLLTGSILDYGCGRGFDASHYGADKFDPHFFPTEPTSQYDTIMCNFVLNVVPENETEAILSKILTCLKPGGVAYLTVRRDKFTEGLSQKGTFQRYVYLDLPIQYETADFAIYRLEKGVSQ